MSDISGGSATPATPVSSPTPSTSTSTPSKVTSTPKAPQTSAQMLSNAQTRQSIPLADLDTGDDGGDADFEASDAPEQDNPLETHESNSDRDASEYSWLDSYKDGLHGVQVQELLQELAEGRIPEALWDKLRLPLQDGDETWEDTLANARNGNMRHAKFTKNQQEHSQRVRHFEAQQAELQAYLSNWKNDPQQLLFGMQRLGLPFDKAAELYARDLLRADELDAASPGAGKEWLESKKMRAEFEDMQRQQQQYQQRLQQEQGQQQTAQTANKVRTSAVNEFKNAGLTLSKGSWNAFKENISAIWEAKGSEPNQSEIREAVLATKEQIDGYVADHRAYTAKQTPAAPKLGGQRLDGGAPKNVPVRAPARGKQPMTTAQLMAKITGGKR